MNPVSDTLIKIRPKRLSRILSAAVILIGCLVLVGWVLNIPILRSGAPSLEGMKANAALAFVLCGLSLWLQNGDDHRWTSAGQALAALVAILGLITFLEHVSGLNMGIDQLLIGDPTASATQYPAGRMVPIAALAFMVLGTALMLLDSRTHLAQLLALTGLFLGLLGLTAFVYHESKAAFGFQTFTQIPVYTAVTILLLSASILSSRPTIGLMATFTSSGPGGVILRRMLLPLGGFLILIVWLGLWVERSGLIEPTFSYAYGVVASLAVLTAMFWWNATMLDRLDLKRKEAGDRVRHLNDILRALRDVNQLIAREKDSRRLLAESCQILLRTRNYRMVWIGLVEEGHKKVVTAASAGEGRDYLAGLEVTWDDSQTGQEPAGTAIRTRRLSVCRDLSMDHSISLWKNAALSSGFRSILATPLVYGDRIFGALSVYADRPDAFDDEEIDLLEELAKDVAYALNSIENETRRIKAEENLKKSEEKYRKIFEDAAVGIFQTSIQGRLLGANPTLARMFGFASAEEIVASITDLGTQLYARSEDRERLKRLLAEHDNVNNFEVEGRKKDGRIIWVSMNICAVRDRNGAIQYLEGTCTDITERKQGDLTRTHSLLRQEKLNLLQQTLLSPGKLDIKLKKITDSVVEIFGADFCRIWITSPGDLCEAGCVHAAVTEGPHVCRYRDLCLRLHVSSGRYTHIDGEVHRRVPFGCYKIGRVASGDEHKFLTNDVQNDLRVHNHDWAKEIGLVSFAGYQLRLSGGETLGVFALFSKQPITAEEDAQLDSLSNTITRVIQTAWEDEELQSLKTQMEFILGATKTGLDIIDAELNIRYIDPEWQKVYGDPTGRKCYDYFMGRDSPCPGCGAVKALQTKAIAVTEEALVKEGSRPIQVTTIPFQNDAGEWLVAEVKADITERKKAEDMLWENEERFRHISELIPDFAYSCRKSPDGPFLIDWITGGIEQITGYTIDEIYEMTSWRPLVVEDDVPIFDKNVVGLSPGESIRSEIRIRKKDGEIVWLASFVKCITDPQNSSYLRTYGGCRDITERKRSEEALQENRRRLADIITFLPDATLAIDNEKRVIIWNRAIEEMTGVFAAEMIGKGDWAYTIPFYGEARPQLMDVVFADSEEIAARYPQITREGASLTAEVFCNALYNNKGAWVFAKASPLHDQSGNIIGAIESIRDITERKRTEEQLRASELRYRRLFEAARDGILLLDAETGMVIDANPFLTEMLGYSHEVVLGKKVWDLGFLKDLVANQAKFAELQQKEYVRYEDLPLETSNGRQIDVEFVSNTYIVNHHSVIQCNIRDITERKRAEEALAKKSRELARSNAELAQFAYVASHDLQEPLRMVTSYVQLLEKRYKGKLDPDADEFIGFAVEGTKRMKQLLHDLLDYSRVSTRGNPLQTVASERVLEAALRNLIVVLEETRGSVTHDPLPEIIADEPQMVQLFQNLIGNGLKFHGPQPPLIHVSAKQEDTNWIFSFQDNGIGIDPQYFEKIFVLFQRLHTRDKYPGTGIGLAIVKKIVERHGGRIWVESEKGKGSTFYFTIPVNGVEKGRDI